MKLSSLSWPEFGSSAFNRKRKRDPVDEGRDIELVVRVSDPVVARLILMIESRSNAGAVEYGAKSIIDRIDKPDKLVSEALEESIDQIIYLFAALSLLSDD